MKAILTTDTSHDTLTCNGPKASLTGQSIRLVEPTLIRKKELARRLSVSIRTIDSWVARRVIPYIKASPRFYLFEFEAVMAELRKHYRVEPSA